MLTRSYTAGIAGVEGYLVTVEADVRQGLPGTTVIGRATGAVGEARERVRAALANCGHDVRPRRQVVNLAPADRRKDSPGVDVAVAVALLAAHEIVPVEALERVMFWGELALDGAVRPAAGTLVVADCAKRHGFSAVAVPEANAAEAALIPDLDVLPVRSLPELIAHLRGEKKLEPFVLPEDSLCVHPTDVPDMADVRGQILGRTAVEVMVAGGHNLLFHGPPGVGKTMLARRAAGLYPALDRGSALEVTKIHSVANGLVPGRFHARPPMRMPHHTVSPAGLLGGGSPARPGEVSLAHRGLLFLDELPEFPRGCLEGLREPLEEGAVTLVRASYAVRFPARFQLMAAMNPCPCGFLGHPDRSCCDPVAAVQRYQQKLSGPLMDRIDLVVPLWPATTEELVSSARGEPTRLVSARIERARRRQRDRLHGTRWQTNAEIPASDGAMERLCRLAPAASRLLTQLARARKLSPRAQHRLRRVARTIGDLHRPSDDLDAPIRTEDIAEAAQLRRLPEMGTG